MALAGLLGHHQRMDDAERERRWVARLRMSPENRAKVRAHLDRQRGLNQLQLCRLEDGSVVAVGSDSEGEDG